ncbi:hypothetical protein LU683_31775 [Pseudomonas asiatica]|uniref:hypothetical protein n=1 Tax=Pseudomonas TaxID=286 RepID=UPI0002A170D3|nr:MULTISPECIES: hypothetical protein [Pseudomonas]AGA74859.1 hypothetical protein B479_19835 [Pseudomonas putida HB3267]MCE0757458.1 hypothetical protein [Pseudomonas asiatica]MCE1029821.1 hypothetical protein [Pseudomonas asiatica]MCE1102294.1 hypothetical protein [Pseudomonas asiatica]MCE1107859.1 hypothetical protein [Pseudomonas asiatica]
MNHIVPAWNPDGLHGEIVQDVTLTAAEIARFNEARESFKLIKALYWEHVVPSLGGFGNPVTGELERLFERVVFDTRNFLYPHRNAAAFHDAKDVGGAV